MSFLNLDHIDELACAAESDSDPIELLNGGKWCTGFSSRKALGVLLKGRCMLALWTAHIMTSGTLLAI